MFTRSTTTVSLILTLMKVELTVNWPAVHKEPCQWMEVVVEGSLFTRSSTTVSLILTLMKVGLTVDCPAVHIEPVPVDGGGGGGEFVHQIH